MNKSILIVGGGLAGLSAALHSLCYGYKPVIAEKNRQTGGRVRSVFAADLKSSIDNGQHVLSASYKETRHFLNSIGSSQKISFQKNFNTLFLRNSDERFHFKALPLPAPWHFFLPLLFHGSFTKIPAGDFINFIRIQKDLQDSELRKLTVSEWLNLCRQGAAIRELLWHPLSLSILNTGPDHGSAWLLYQAVSRSFLGSRKFAGLGIPGDWLSEIFGNPAEKYIQNHGCSLHVLTRVNRLVCDNDQIVRVETNKQHFTPRAVILAIPPYALHDLLESSRIPPLDSLKKVLNTFGYHPIMTVNIYLSRPLPFDCPISVVSSPVQWIFAHPRASEIPGVRGYALVISAADEWVNKSRKEVMAMISSELCRLFGQDSLQDNPVLAFKIIKEKRATVSQTPDFLQLRPSARTAIKNLFLCGDWIDTGLPATIEGAILSGKIAVEELIKEI